MVLKLSRPSEPWCFLHGVLRCGSCSKTGSKTRGRHETTEYFLLWYRFLQPPSQLTTLYCKLTQIETTVGATDLQLYAVNATSYVCTSIQGSMNCHLHIYTHTSANAECPKRTDERIKKCNDSKNASKIEQCL